MSTSIPTGYYLSHSTYHALLVCILLDSLQGWDPSQGLSSTLLSSATPIHFKIQSDADATNQLISSWEL